MKSLFTILILSLMSVSSFSATAYKVQLESVNLLETGDYDYFGGDGEVYFSLDTVEGNIPLSLRPFSIPDNNGESTIKSGLAVFIPQSIIENGQVELRMNVTDLDLGIHDPLMAIEDTFNLNNDSVKFINHATGEFVKLKVTKVEVDSKKMNLSEYQTRSINIQKLTVKLEHTNIFHSSVNSNEKAVEQGRKNFKILHDIRASIFNNEGGENHEELVKLYNKKIWSASYKSIISTDWINERFDALPQARKLLIK